MCAKCTKGAFSVVWLFALSAAWVGWAYGGWLVGLVLVDAVRRLKENGRGDASCGSNEADCPLPRLSVLIAAHDESAVIAAKLANTLALDWPKEKIEILVGSDGSTDGTDEIVREYAGQGVVLSSAPRGGKASVLNRLARLATGDVFLFTDANTMIAPDAPRLLCAALRDPRVAVVSGKLRLVTPEGGDACEGLYWRYETLLKRYESQLGALVGANGGLYILRSSLWEPLRPDTIVDDFVVSMRPLMKGFRAVYEPAAVAEEETAPSVEAEWRRRVRIAAGNFQSLRELHPLLRSPSFAALAFWSHKMARWTAPFALCSMLISSAFLLPSPLWTAVFTAQLVFYALAIAARMGVRGTGPSLARYFTEMNAALLVGLIRCLRGSQAAAWQRTARPGNRRAA